MVPLALLGNSGMLFPSLSFYCVIRALFTFDDTVYESIAIRGLRLDYLKILTYIAIPFSFNEKSIV